MGGFISAEVVFTSAMPLILLCLAQSPEAQISKFEFFHLRNWFSDIMITAASINALNVSSI